MINLLPKQEKENLELLTKKKLSIVVGGVLMVSLGCLALILWALSLYILQQSYAQKITLDATAKTYQTPDIIATKNLIKKYNASFAAIDAFYKKSIYVSEALKLVSEIQKPANLRLTSIDMQTNKNTGKITMTIRGISETRDDLMAFKNNIENNEKISNVYFPLNNWIKPSDINFYMTLEIGSAG